VVGLKGYSPFLVGGAACLLITYNISRNGTLLLTAMIIILVAATAYYAGCRLGRPRTVVASGWFVFGALCSSVSFYVRLVQDVEAVAASGTSIHEVAALEWIAISVLGTLTIATSAYLARKYFSDRRR